MPLWQFGFLAALAVVSSLGVIVQRNAIHCLLALVFTLLVIAALFIGLGAVTVGLLQVIVYAGAIMVLFLFVIWLLNLATEAIPPGYLALKLFGTLAAAALAAELFVFTAEIHPGRAARPVPPAYGSIDSLAATLFRDYLVAFEVTSILLLVAVVGAIVVARRVTEGRPQGGGAPRAGALP